MRQSLQWMHRSACALNSSVPQSRGSTAPVATWRIRFACDRGEAASCPRAPEARAHPQRRVERPAGCRSRGRPTPSRASALGPAQGRLDDRGRGAAPPDRARRSPDWRAVAQSPDAARPRSRRLAPRGVRRRGFGSEPLARRVGPRLQVPDHQVRIVADDLARVELAQRVERILDLAEDLDELAVLPAEELGPGQAAGLRARDRAAGLEHDLVDLGRQRLELGPIARVGQVQERPEAAALAGAGVERPGDVLLLEELWSRWRTAASCSGGTATSSKTETGRAGPRNRIRRGSTSAAPAQESFAFRPLERPRTARRPAARVRSICSIDLADLRGDLVADRRPRIRPSGSIRPTRRSQSRKTASASRARRSERRSRRSHERRRQASQPRSSGNDAARRDNRRNGSTTTAWAAGSGTVRSTAWVTRASVPSEPASSRPRWIPDSSAARASA